MNLPRFLSLALTATLTTTLTAQIDRESNVRVDYEHLRHASLNDVQTWSALGYRMSNFEVYNASTMELNVSMVRNTGVYAATWLFQFDKTIAQLQATCANNNMRIVDLERYQDGGVDKFAALLFQNTGQQQKSWNWFTAIPQGSVYSTVNNAGDRIIDLEPYQVNGNWYYHAITIANTGADNKAWWVYTNTDIAGVQGYMAQHDARLYDFETKTIFMPFTCACVLVADAVRSHTEWGEFYGSGFDLDDEMGARVTGLASTFGSHVVTMLDNFDAFDEFGAGCVGTHGASQHTATGSAMTGTQITYRANHLWPWTIAVLCYGQTELNIPLFLVGAPGCFAYTSPLATTTIFANGSGIATSTLNVPVNPSLQGAELITQFAALDPPLNDLGMQFSNGIVTTIRHW